jgi:hypothetical protein
VQLARDRHQIARAVQHQRRAPHLGQSNGAQRQVHRGRAFIGPAQPTAQEVAQLQQPGTLRDQRQATQRDLGSRSEKADRLPVAIDPRAVAAAHIEEPPPRILVQRARVPSGNPRIGEPDHAAGIGADEPFPLIGPYRRMRQVVDPIARPLAQVNHPNIVSVIDFDRDPAQGLFWPWRWSTGKISAICCKRACYRSRW